MTVSRAHLLETSLVFWLAGFVFVAVRLLHALLPPRRDDKAHTTRARAAKTQMPCV
jgi:hypothetical protein